MVVVKKQEVLGTHDGQSREVEEQNRLRDWRKQNREKAKEIVVQIEKSKEIVVQAKKSIKWRG